MLIAGLNKTTLLDYPGHVAATVFTGGCNFRCPFCHNRGLVLEPLAGKTYEESEIFDFLHKRKKVLKGVCITGGEPAMQADLPEFIKKIKDMGFLVKLDTNGYAPKVLERLLAEGLLDYVAMDIKNSPDKYAVTAGMAAGADADVSSEGADALPEGTDVFPEGAAPDRDTFYIEKIEKSVMLLKSAGIDYEFRTTVVKEFHRLEDLLKIADWIKGCPRYFLQQFQENENVLSGRHKLHGYTEEEMQRMAEALRKVPGMKGEVLLRGV